jgi:hypothetical protein
MNRATKPTTSIIARLAPALFFALALGLRLVRLGAQSLWLDEGGTWDVVTSRPWGSLLADLWSARAGYPLYHLLMKGWVAVAGDSEWALRLPSALGGAAAVALLYVLGRRLGGARVGALAAALLLVNPLALWMAQDAKVYSLLLALVIWSLLALLDAIELGGRRRWLIWLGLIAALLLTYRLTLLLVIGQAALVGLYAPLAGRLRRVAQFAPLALLIGLAWGLSAGIQQDPNAPAVAARINPGRALLILLERFAFDRPPRPTIWWALLSAAALIMGGLAVWQRARGGQKLPARLLAGAGLLPLILFLAALGLGAPLFEPRYISYLLPCWAVLLAFGLDGMAGRPVRRFNEGMLIGPLAGIMVVVQIYGLFARPYGLWSGAPVKEDYRGAIGELARRVVPGDVVVVHPPYIAPLYRYYAPRLSPDALPAPRAFGRSGALGYSQGEFDNDYAGLLAGARRGWLLIAPENARTIDPPNPQFPQDDMGRVGINFLTADMNGKWRCVEGPYRGFNGLRLLCQSFPRPLQAGSLELRGDWPVPTSDTARWGESLELLGYQLAPWPGGLQPGGTLPISLTWRTRAALPTDYRMFIHLVPALGAPVAAQLDAAPLGGGLPTGQWPPDAAIHDEVAVPLPAALPAGRYLVVLGWYDPAIADIQAQRLPVTAHSGAAGETFVVLGEVAVGGR